MSTTEYSVITEAHSKTWKHRFVVLVSRDTAEQRIESGCVYSRAVDAVAAGQQAIEVLELAPERSED